MHLLVLGSAAAPYLKQLQALPLEWTFSTGPEPQDHWDHAPDAQAALLCMGNAALLQPLWPNLKRLAWVHSLSSGVEQVLFPDLVQAPQVTLTNAAGVYADALAEWVMASALHLVRDVPRLIRQQQERRWEPFTVETLKGKTLLLAGLGGIGRAVARRATAFGMRVVAVKRNAGVKQDHVERVGSLQDLDAWLPDAHVVVNALPATPHTVGLFDASRLGRLRRDAVFINVGRGQTVDEPALVHTLQEGRIKGAALDVFAQEPLPPESPLWALPNVLLSPHSADQTATWLEESMALFMANTQRFQRGEPLQNVVDKVAGY